MMRPVLFLALLGIGTSMASSAWAGFAQNCVDTRGRPMNYNNEQVLQWKSSTPNQYKDRGYIQGVLVGVLRARESHIHLDVFVGNDGSGKRGRDTDIEIIYNQEFGEVPTSVRPGAQVIACGDYITSTEQSGHFPPSPLGAILHWVHKDMGRGHPNGFLIIDGQVYGQMDAPPRRFDPAAGFESFWNAVGL